MSDLQRSLLKANLTRGLNRATIRALLGDASGRIYDPQNPNSGYVYVRQQTSNGYSTAQRVRGPYQGASVQMIPGNPIILKYDTDGQLFVAGTDFQGAVAGGSNPNANNASDQNVNQWTNQASIVTLVSHCTAPPSTSILVRGWFVIHQWIISWFPAGILDMATAGSGSTSLIPAAGNQCIAVVVLKSDNTTLAAYASTAKNDSEILTVDDIQEALFLAMAADPLATPVWAWKLHDAQTTITDLDSFLDLRGIVNLTETIQTDFTQDANVTVASTAAETTLVGAGIGSLSFIAGALSAKGRQIRLDAWGYVSDTGTPTLQLKFKLGSTVILDSGAVTLGAGISNKLWHFGGVATVQTAGASGKIFAQGTFTQNGTVTDIVATAQISIDLTVALTADVTATWGTSSPSNTITCSNLSMELLH